MEIIPWQIKIERLFRNHSKISIEELKKMSQKTFGGLVKAVVDIEK